MLSDLRITAIILIGLLQSLGLASSLKELGDGGRIGLPIAAAMVTLGHHDKTGLRQLGLSVGTSIASAALLKKVINESRPDGSSRNSFPSGHATWAFSAAGYLHQRYGWKIGLPAMLVAGSVGYSRIALKRHYLHDVVAAAALGIGMSILFTDRYQPGSFNTRVSFYATPNQIGLQWWPNIQE